MVQQSMVLLILIISNLAFGQDERYYRQILTGELPNINQQIVGKVIAPFSVTSPDYNIDLDGDGIEEIIATEKRDGVDWIHIANAQGFIVFKTSIPVYGASSTIYKIRYVNISQTVKALIVFFDEGVTHSKKFESTARILVLSYENDDIKKMTLAMGPHIFQEKEAQREQYFRRDYQVNVYDINNDGIREIAVQYNHIHRIMKYEKGVWNRY